MNIATTIQMPRTEVFNAQIEHPSAWTRKDVRSKDDLARESARWAEYSGAFAAILGPSTY